MTGISVSGGNATDKVLDGDRDGTYDLVEKDTEIVFDFGRVYYLSHVNFVFEKGELGLKYQVFAEDASGNRTTLSDKSESSGTLGDKTVRVLVGENISKIIFKHLGNNGDGPAYLAESRLYEFEAFGVAKSESNITTVPTEASVLLGGSADYTAAADGTVELTLEKATDLNMLSITRTSDETRAIKYKVEYLDLETNTWKLFADLTENSNTASSISFALAAESVFAQKLKLTFSEEVKLSGIQVYNTDYAGMLSERISQIEGILKSLTFGDTYGSYREEARTKLESVLSEAKAAQGINSQTIDEWLEKVNSALEEFYDTGAVSVERDGLLAVMADAVDLMEQLEVYGLTSYIDAVMESYQTARTAYEVYKSSQSQIQTAETTLSTGIQGTAELVKAIADQPQLAEARITLRQYIDGLSNKQEENYTPDSWAAYQTAITEAETVLNNAQAQTAAISEAKRQLEQAIENLKLLVEHPVERIVIHAENDKRELTEGEIVQLTVTTTPDNAENQTVEWTSSAPEKAEVDENGMVTAHAAGEVKITAKATDGSDVTGEITLTIKERTTEEPIKVQRITVRAAEDKTELNVGETVQLTADVLPETAENKEVEWKSGAPEKAEVDGNGLVRAKAAGEVEITAAAKEDSSITGSIKLTVTANTGGGSGGNQQAVLVKSITLSASKTSLTVGSTVKVSAVIFPTNAANKALAWNSNNNAVATVGSDGTVKAKSAGTVTITATARDESRKSGSIKLTVTKPEPVLPAVGTPYGSEYTVTQSSALAKTVIYKGPAKKNAKTVVIPESVEINGYTYQVTEIASKAFMNNRKIKTVVIGANIKKIGKKAFSGCKKLADIKILSTSLKKIDKTVFKGIYKKAKITVPKKKYNAYKKLLKKAKLPKTIKIKKK